MPASMTTPEIVVLVKDCVVALAALVTGTVATIGLSKWRREATFEVARALARATCKVRDEVRNCRAPG